MLESICENEFGKCRVQASDCFTPVTCAEMFLKQKMDRLHFEMSAASVHNQVAFSRNVSLPQECGISWDPARFNI